MIRLPFAVKLDTAHRNLVSIRDKALNNQVQKHNQLCLGFHSELNRYLTSTVNPVFRLVLMIKEMCR